MAPRTTLLHNLVMPQGINWFQDDADSNLTFSFQIFETECSTVEEEECYTKYEEKCEPTYKVTQSFVYRTDTQTYRLLEEWGSRS